MPGTKSKKATKAAAKKRYEDRKSAHQLATALRDVPDNQLTCRGLRHAWAVDEDFHVYHVEQEGRGRQTMHIARKLGCMRGCGCSVLEVYIQTRYGRIERIERITMYPPGYLIAGVPRGVKPQSIVQQEAYRRSMESTAKAHRGDRASADGDRYARQSR